MDFFPFDFTFAVCFASLTCVVVAVDVSGFGVIVGSGVVVGSGVGSGVCAD